MTRVNNSLYMKETNKLRILDLIRKGECSRADVARVTGLSRAAVTIIVDDLIKNTLVLEGHAAKSDSGRRPTMLKLNPDAYIAIGVDVSREGCGILFSDFTSRPVFKSRVELCYSAEQTVDEICEIIKTELQNLFAHRRVLGIGVCCPGPVDTQSGTILNPPGLDMFHNFKIKEAVEQRLSLRVTLQKDTNALAVAERNVSGIDGDLMFILADHGLGCGIIKDGKIFCGYGGMGCEIGHTTVKFDGDTCRCGNVGCAELYASIPSILKNAKDAGCECENISDLVKLAKEGDSCAAEALRCGGEMLGVACVNAVNIFEPDYIVLGGELGESSFIIKEAIKNRIDMTGISRDRHSVHVVCSALDEDARAFAAAETVIEGYILGGQINDSIREA
ncbi:MAG: ROK family transcriptional regulator [Ruminococcaceae bacterium]|nr:ROK family transcriptional regulator [Oscillospiraceae bacterium]